MLLFSDEYNNNDKLKYSDDLAFLRGLSSDQESYLYSQPQQVMNQSYSQFHQHFRSSFCADILSPKKFQAKL